DRKRHQRDIGQLLGQLRHGARHVVGRGHHDQRGKTALAHPAPRLDRVAGGVDRRMIEVDAARDQALVARIAARDLGRAGCLMHPADQQALAVPGGEQFDGVGDTRRAAGEHHDTIRVTVERDFGIRHVQHEPDEAAAEDDDDGEQDEQYGAHEPAHHPIALSVRCTVSRAMPAVTAATSTIRPSIAPWPSGPSDRLPNSAPAWASPGLPVNQFDMKETSANRIIAAAPPSAPPLRPSSRKWRWNSPAMKACLAPTTCSTAMICRLVDIAPRVANITDSMVAASTSARIASPTATALRAIARMRSMKAR